MEILKGKMYEGRVRDSFQTPHRNRTKVHLKFWLKGDLDPKTGKMVPIIFGGVMGFPDKDLEKHLKIHRDAVIEANKDVWFRPKYRQVYLGLVKGEKAYRMEPVMDLKTGRQVIESLLLQVTYEKIGPEK